MIAQDLAKELEIVIGRLEGLPVKTGMVRALAGGSINNACMVEIGNRPYFVKWNSSQRYPGMFEAEAAGLKLLASAGVLRIPEVAATGEVGNLAYLLLEYITPGRLVSGSWTTFGKQLAALHRHSNTAFGLGSDNYIGSLPQRNGLHCQSWAEFFVEYRLRPQLSQAMQSGIMPLSALKQSEKLFERMDQLFPQEPPSLLHGDLWSGNFLFDIEANAVLIDPAVYYGHREMDLAMSRLFGGFDPQFYFSYHESWPLENGWQERVDLCNLYPLLVHVNLFGGAYARQVQAILNRFI